MSSKLKGAIYSIDVKRKKKIEGEKKCLPIIMKGWLKGTK
jgi:hypothetical protein